MSTSLAGACTLSGTENLTGGPHKPRHDAGVAGDGDADDGGTTDEMDASVNPSDGGSEPGDDAATPPADAAVDEPDPSACNDIRIELDYLANASWSAGKWTYADTPKEADAAYGAINDFRIDKAGAESVHPGRSAMAIIGMMEGVATLDALECKNPKRANHVKVIDAFFLNWLASFAQTSASQADAGAGSADGGTAAPFAGMPSELRYDKTGALTFTSPDVSSLATAQVLLAMTKYLERSGTDDYRDTYFDFAVELADTLTAKLDPSTKLVTEGSDALVEDNAFAAMALRNLGRWASHTTRPELRPVLDRRAADIEQALQGFKDTTASSENFARLRVSGGAGSYAGSIDIGTIAPYYLETVSKAEPFAARVSDFWTQGKFGTTKLSNTNTAAAADYYGVRAQVFDTARAENQRLSASATLKLARMEWALFQITRDDEYKTRALNRLKFVREASKLWYGVPATKEGNIAGGFLEWRNDSNDTLTTDKAKRYVDISADFIMDVAAIDLGRTVRYAVALPDEVHIEAEEYDYTFGVLTESCGEGGLNLREVGNGDYVRYDKVGFAGVKAFALRVASQQYGASIGFHRDTLAGTLMGTCTAKTTGGWQTYETVSCAANNMVGSGSMFVTFTGPGSTNNLPNVNWIELRNYVTREAEKYDDQAGFMTDTDAYVTTTKKLGHAGNGDWAAYDNTVFDGMSQIVLRSNSGRNPGSFEIRRDPTMGSETTTGSVLGTCEMNTTSIADKWDQWTLTYCPLKESTGTGRLVIVVKGEDSPPGEGLPDLDWFTLQ